MSNVVTADLSQFGYRELSMGAVLLEQLSDGNRPEDFDFDGVTLNMNTSSGNVFLSNSEYEVAMMNGDKLESFYTCPYCGHEGFKDEMEHQPEDEDCTEYLKQIGVIAEEDSEDVEGGWATACPNGHTSAAHLQNCETCGAQKDQGDE